jgi:hypothetical protein
MNQFKYLVIICIALFGIGSVADASDYKLRLGDSGGIYFLDRGWFSNGLYQIRVINGEWHWQTPDKIWKPIATPYEYQEKGRNWVIVLDKHGEIYMRSVDRLERDPLKVINGVWHYYASGEWLELFPIE